MHRRYPLARECATREKYCRWGCRWGGADRGRLVDLLGARFRGDNPLLQLFDEALRDSVLLVPQ